MSVIPLTTEGPNPTVVQNQTEFDIEGSAILIVELDLAQLTQEGASNVSYDLRIGDQCRDHREKNVRQIPERGVVRLHPGSALIIQTEEWLHLPRRMYGTIAPKVSLLERGLSSTFSKVDPGYRGHLLITLFNLGKTTATLHERECFCALTLFEVAPGARLYEKGTKHITAPPTKQPRRSLREWLEVRRVWLEVHHIAIMIFLVIVTLWLAIEHFLSRRHS